jgi:hypothetical protein
MQSKSPQRNRGIIPFIIMTIVFVFVALFVMGYFTEQHPFGLPNYKHALNLPCGLTVYAPVKDKDVAFPYILKGYGNGCGWEPLNSSLGTASVLAGNGLMIAQTQLTVNDVADGKPYYFEVTVDAPLTFFGEKGTVIFDNGRPGFDHKQVIVPIRFASHL